MESNDFNMQPVQSGNLQEVGFSEKTKKGRILFASGALYEYDNCTQEEADSIVNAPSANDGFNAVWRGKKTYRKV